MKSDFHMHHIHSERSLLLVLLDGFPLTAGLEYRIDTWCGWVQFHLLQDIESPSFPHGSHFHHTGNPERTGLSHLPSFPVPPDFRPDHIHIGSRFHFHRKSSQSGSDSHNHIGLPGHFHYRSGLSGLKGHS